MHYVRMCLLSSILDVHRVTPMVRFLSVLLYRPSSTGKESLSSGLPICMWWHTTGTRIAVLPSGEALKSLVNGPCLMWGHVLPLASVNMGVCSSMLAYG